MPMSFCDAGGAPKVGTVEEFKGETKAYPAVVFCHGSSGVNPQIKIFAQWLADALRVAVVVPDSMQTEAPSDLLLSRPGC